MVVGKGFFNWFWVAGFVSAIFMAPAAFAQQASSASSAESITFRGVDYEHRWSKAGQNEFTPRGQEDLSSWRDMITLNLYEGIADGESLAGMANVVLGRYQLAGKIIYADSRPATPDSPAEHLIVALLGDPAYMEAVFARFMLIDGAGVAIFYCRREYGASASVAQAIGQWLQDDGQKVENALMALDEFPTPAALKALPQSD